MINNSKITHIHNYKGFTLAETLITLVIIGVVAALTVPNMIVHYQKEQAVTKLKKTYSTLSQSINKAIADHGPVRSWTILENSNTKAKDFADTYMIPYLNVGKNCEYNTEGDCSFKYAYLNAPDTMRELNNVHYRFYLSDGTLIALTAAANNVNLSTLQNGQYVPFYTFFRSMAMVYVDINGQKKPNTLGKDIFIFQYNIQYDMGENGGDRSGQFFPSGYEKQSRKAAYYRRKGCNRDSIGDYCAVAIMTDGWRMSEEYPW